MDPMRLLALIVLVVGACSFTPGSIQTLSDAAPDGPPPITVGFAKSSTMTDESVPLTQIRVLLSKPGDADITVAFAVTGGSADRPNDFLLDDGTLTFAPGEVEKTIDITVGADGTAEPDETIELTLTNATGPGAVLINTMHTVTISANTLPRVTFEATMSNAAETTSPTINVVLDKTSLITIAVEIDVMSGTATGGGIDYTLATTTVTFDPGETTQPVTLTVINDPLDEANEDVMLELANPTNVVIGTESTREHVINDDDAAPTVGFDMVASTVGEGGTMVDLAVSLSAISGKSFDVPFSIGNTGTAASTDYSVVTASPLAFPAGTQTQNIRINIVQDVLAETNETIVVTLGAPNPMANATLGATTHTVTITDDDETCLGTGNYALCFTPPTAAVAVAGAINTDTSPLCSAAGPLSGWTGGPSSCFVVGTSISVAATQVTGSKPLVLFATGAITVTGDLDVASHRGGTTGPGANTPCAAYTDNPLDSTSGGGGGAGGTFRTAGGRGGEGNGANNSEGSPVAVGTAPTVLRGGCPGQRGGHGAGNNGGDPGAGGGAVYLVAGSSLTINSGVTINASGAGGDARVAPDAGLFAGGGGGGSGGMIKLHAASFTVSGARLMANGGGGSSGADSDVAGADGFDASTVLPTFGGAAGANIFAGASGGTGFGTSTTSNNASDGNSNQGGGGGGGGGGFVASNLALSGATVSAGDIDP